MQETVLPAASLRERVQSLRLPERVDSGRGGRGGWLPWALCLLLAASTASLAARVYTAPPREPTQPGAVHTQQAAPTTDAAPAAATGKTTPAGDNKPAAGAVALESKGYIIPAHQIQVSPIEVGGRVTLSYRKPEFARPKPDNVEKLNKLIVTALEDPALQERAQKLGIEARGSTPEAMRERMARDVARWRGVIEKANIVTE